MMTPIKKIYHFLGGIHFAIILISTVAVLTIIGTFIESKTDSHRYAALFTYENPFFIFLLGCFFVNILVAALRRWPFKNRHVPFLITHTGLLMILAGALVKSFYGTQGSMAIMEGSASREILQTGTHMIQMEPFDENAAPHRYAITQNFFGHFTLTPLTKNNPKLELVNYFPHSKEYFQTWIRGSQGFISGRHPFPVYEWNDSQQEKLPASTQLDSWEIYAFRTSTPQELVPLAYLQNLELRIIDRTTQEVVYQGLLKQALKNPIPLLENEATLTLSLELPSLEELVSPQLTLKTATDQVEIFLSGPESLLNQRQSQHLGNSPFAVDLKRPPTLLFVVDDDEDLHLFAFDAQGRVHSQTFRQGALSPILVYGKGFGGYAVQSALAFNHEVGRQELEASQRSLLVEQLKERMKDRFQLAPPLALFQQACAQSKQEFAESCIAFLSHWNNYSGWLYPKNVPLPKNLESIFSCLAFSQKEQKACHWISQVFQEIDPQLNQGEEVGVILKDIQWPLTFPSENTDSETLLVLLSQQIFAASELLPNSATDAPLSLTEKAHFLSAYLRTFGIHWSTISTVPATHFESLELEAPLTSAKKKIAPTRKMEENLPMATFRLFQQDKSQAFSLTYDRFASGLRWPVLEGNFLVRFQPQFKEIPYKIRLRNARQINYANSTQPYSYESDLIVTDLRSGVSIEKTISMNQVHETWDGYRFYLANITPATETAVRQVQIVVNHDPAKYWLTYPGALILSLGIFLLFWIRPYRRHYSRK